MATMVQLLVHGPAKENSELSQTIPTNQRQNLGEYYRIRTAAARTTFCHAPSVNLNFDQMGNATACCYNRRFLLGTYPRHSVDEIWNGEPVRQLRKYLEEDNLEHGCNLCAHQLDAGNYSGLRAIAFDEYAAPMETDVPNLLMPRVIEFEISNICNLECIMCNGYFSSSIRKNREKLEPMPKVFDEKFVEQLEPYWKHVRQAKFLGGEPFLNPLYYKIWNAIRQHGPSIDVVITTNATVMNDKVRDLVENLRPSIVVSCDALDKATYEHVRVNAVFEEFFEHLGYFLESGRKNNKPVTLGICPTTVNWKSLPEILDFCNANQCVGFFHTVVTPPELSIRYLAKDAIAEIHSYLSSAIAISTSAPLQWWEKINLENYRGMLKQFDFWQSSEPKDFSV
jgi:MoaA/NifB/PqqE/SkfB family radical SAM enzyme